MEFKIIEDAINPLLLNSLCASWPDASSRFWHHYSGKNAEKYASKSHNDLPEIAKLCTIEMIKRITPYVDCNVFPDMEFHGAGLHMIPSGGYLRRHLDSSLMESTGWKREYSCVLSVNKHWQDDYGGAFVLGDTEILPKFNQLITFKCTDESFHEVKDVVGPDPRCTLCVFLWSKNDQSKNIRKQAYFV